MNRYWIGVASRDHMRKTVEDGFCQFSHGSAAAVARVKPGDGIAYYSPREQMRDGDPVQAFTAIGIVGDGDPEQVGGETQFRPTRRKVNYANAEDALIAPSSTSFPSRADGRIGGSYFAAAFCRSQLRILL